MTAFGTKVLKWFYLNKRSMPWRGEKDPYRIWLSEVMLQQTQVNTVTPYYQRWLEAFPTLKSVALASEDQILKVWEGLGYYARARNFWKACQKVLDLYGGIVPNNPEIFSQLNGVGPYITAAVQSIAFKQVIPTIDGNVKRVVARVMCLDRPPSKSYLAIEDFLKHHISHKVPGDFNQAIMELGALVCRSKNPLCNDCPVLNECQAFQTQKTEFYPIKEKKKKSPHHKIAVGIVWRGDKVLISRRKSGGLLGGLWEFPGGKIQKKETAFQCATREVKEEVGITVRPLQSVGVVKHAYTHFSIEMEGIICQYVRGKISPLECDKCQWIPFCDISKFAFPKANHKLFELMEPLKKYSLKKGFL